MKFKAFVLLACICSSVIVYAKPKAYETGKVVDIHTEQRMWDATTFPFHTFRITTNSMVYTASSVLLIPSDIAIGDDIQFRIDSKNHLYIMRSNGELKLVLEDRVRTSDASSRNPINPYDKGIHAHIVTTVPTTDGASVASGNPTNPETPSASTMPSPQSNDAQTPIEKQRKRDEIEHSITIIERNIESNKKSLAVMDRPADRAGVEKVLREQMEHLANLYHQLAALQ